MWYGATQTHVPDRQKWEYHVCKEKETSSTTSQEQPQASQHHKLQSRVERQVHPDPDDCRMPQIECEDQQGQSHTTCLRQRRQLHVGHHRRSSERRHGVLRGHRRQRCSRYARCHPARLQCGPTQSVTPGPIQTPVHEVTSKTKEDTPSGVLERTHLAPELPNRGPEKTFSEWHNEVHVTSAVTWVKFKSGHCERLGTHGRSVYFLKVVSASAKLQKIRLSFRWHVRQP